MTDRGSKTKVWDPLFGVSNGKLGFENLLPNSASKLCYLHQAAGGSRGCSHFNGSDGEKHGKPGVFQGWLLEKAAFTGKFYDFRGFAGLHQFRRLQRKFGA